MGDDAAGISLGTWTYTEMKHTLFVCQFVLKIHFRHIPGEQQFVSGDPSILTFLRWISPSYCSLGWFYFILYAVVFINIISFHRRHLTNLKFAGLNPDLIPDASSVPTDSWGVSEMFLWYLGGCLSLNCWNQELHEMHQIPNTCNSFTVTDPFLTSACFQWW